MQVCPEAPGDPHHSDLCISCTSSCAIPSACYKPGTYGMSNHLPEKEARYSTVASTSFQSAYRITGPSSSTLWLKCWLVTLQTPEETACLSYDEQHLSCKDVYKGGSFDVMLSKCPASSVKGVFTAMWAASPTSWHLTDLETKFITLRNFWLCSLFLFFLGHFTTKSAIILSLPGKSQTFLLSGEWKGRTK